MSNTWFTSDTHFLHRNIISYCDRPFVDPELPQDTKDRLLVDQMDEHIIQEWNKVVKPYDTVYHLGDFAYTGKEDAAIDLRVSLNGNLHLIMGNHDQHAVAMHRLAEQRGRIWHWYDRVAFKSVEKISDITVNGQVIILCHYALREWWHALRGTWHLFGHTHATLGPFGKSVDVGIDNASNVSSEAKYRPLHFDEIKAYMDKQPIGPHPGFEHYRPGHPELKARSYPAEMRL